MTAKDVAIRNLYAQVGAPQWAATNLDGLADVLRDLSWLPEAPIRLTVPDLSGLAEQDRGALLGILRRAAAQRALTSRPIELEAPGGET